MDPELWGAIERYVWARMNDALAYERGEEGACDGTLSEETKETKAALVRMIEARNKGSFATT